MRTFLIASLRTHARRYLAVAVAVLIATTFMVATNALSAAARDGWNGAIASEFEGADAVVTDAGGDAASRIEKADGVDAVSESATTFLGITAGNLDAVASVGTVADAEALRWQDLERGHYPSGRGEALIGADRAESAGVGVGDALTIDAGDRTLHLTIAGVARTSTGELGSSVYLTESAMAAAAMGESGSRLVVAFRGTSDLDALRAAAPGATVQSVDGYVHQLQLDATGGIDIMQRMLFVFASIALIVAALVIANTLGIVLAQRTRDFALLRCVGALRRQIVRVALLETLAVSAVAAATGVPLGLGLAYVGVDLLGDAWPAVALADPSLSVAGAAVPALVAVGVAVVASIAPARRMNRLAPLAALRPGVAATVRSRTGLLRVGAAGVLLLAGVAGLAVGAGTGALPIAMVGGGSSFVGVLLLGPLLIPALIGAVRPLVGRVAGVPGRLAAANAVRNRNRTAATSAALLIGVTLISTVIVGTASMKESTATEMDRRAPVDMVLDSEHPLDGAVAGSVGRIDGVDRSVSLDGTPVKVGGERTVAVGVDPDVAEVVRPEATLQDIEPGEIFVPSETAGNLSNGDTVRVEGPSGTMRLEVVLGTGFGRTAVVSAATLGELDGDASPYAVWLRAADDADVESVVGELNALAEGSGAMLDGSLPERESIMSALDIVLAITVGLLGIAVLIAVVGVGNTLSLSVLERVRENSLLRALGLRRAQQRSMLAVEALLIAGVASVLGIGLGLAYAWFGIRTLAAEAFVTTPSLAVPVGQLLAVLAVAAVAGLVASLLPARRAGRIPPVVGLAAD